MSYQAKFTGWQNLALEDLVGAYRKSKLGKKKQLYAALILLCQINAQVVIPAGKRVSSAMDGRLKPIHGAWIRFAL